MENKIGRWSVIAGIVIVLNLFFNYAISLAYKAPQYEDFCTPKPYMAEPLDQKTADMENERYVACQKSWDEAYGQYNRTVFIVLVVLGAITVALANFVVINTVIASGLSLAGVLSFVIASMRYWDSASDWIRLFILAVALGLLFWVAINKFNESR